MINAEGTVLFGTVGYGTQGNPTARVVELSLRTGKLLAAFPGGDESGHGIFCGILWTDPSGRHLVLEGPGNFGLGRVDNGVFTSTLLHVPVYDQSSLGLSEFLAW
jgi:hypothetical protein